MSSLEDTAQRHAEHVVEKFSSFSVNVNFPKNENKFCNYKLCNFKFFVVCNCKTDNMFIKSYDLINRTYLRIGTSERKKYEGENEENR